jgi:hypothetical protein
VSTKATRGQALIKVSGGLKDPSLARLVRSLEDKISELDARVRDLERRASAGGI